MKKILVLMLALGLAVPANAVNKSYPMNYAAKKQQRQKLSDIIGISMFVVGAILLSLALSQEKIRSNNEKPEKPAFEEPEQTGQIHHDEPPQSNRELDDQTEEDGFSYYSDDDSDVSDTHLSPEWTWERK
jgi:hypothetical protein